MNRSNLNLLVAFDALMSEQHVTRAGEKIYITQSAMSSALAQLRELFADPLLVRDGKKMKPTPRALELAPQVKQILKQVEQLVTPSDFDPKTSTRTFRIGMSDYVEFVLLPKLLQLLDKRAPQVRLKISHLNTLDSKQLFDVDQLDLGIGVSFVNKPESLASESLFFDESICLTSSKHPLAQKSRLTLKDYTQAKHLVILFPQEPYRSLIDTRLNELGIERDAVVSVPHVMPILFALRDTSYLITTASKIGYAIAKPLGLVVYNAPFKTKCVHIEQAWPKHMTNDPGHHWLRQLMSEAAASLIDGISD